MKADARSGQMQLRPARESDTIVTRKLLEGAKLHTESLETGLTSFYLAEQNGALAGMAGFEFYSEDAILRSVAVPEELRKRGIGGEIVDRMIAIARKRRVRRIVLFTETAQKFFEKKGFRTVDRSSIDNDAMKRSSQFTIVCPQSAVCMVLELRRWSPTLNRTLTGFSRFLSTDLLFLHSPPVTDRTLQCPNEKGKLT